MYAEWMDDISLEITEEELENYEKLNFRNKHSHKILKGEEE